MVTLPMSPGRHRWEWMLHPGEDAAPHLEPAAVRMHGAPVIGGKADGEILEVRRRRHDDGIAETVKLDGDRPLDTEVGMLSQEPTQGIGVDTVGYVLGVELPAAPSATPPTSTSPTPSSGGARARDRATPARR